MKWYGSTSDASTTPPREGSGGGGENTNPYTTPHQDRRPSLLPRNESVGGSTARTSESEPLLGEQLLLGNCDEEEEPEDIDPKSMFLSPGDVSTIAKEGSDHEIETSTIPATPASAALEKQQSSYNDPEDRDLTPKQSGSPRKSISRPNSDPHIGLNVELDTLAYSRDPDESTLLSNDNFTKRYLEGEKRKQSLIKRIFSSDAETGTDPPYLLVCIGLGVGIGLCAIAALAYLQYSHHFDASLENITSSSEGTWHGVPFMKIGRESFGDPVENILDVELFHPSLLHGGKVPNGGKQSTPPKTAPETNQDDDSNLNRRKLASSPKPFLRVPFPTGAFWTNLVLLPKSKQKNQHSYPIVAYPYSYQWSSLGKLQASYSASRRVVKATSIQDAFAPDISLGSVETIHSRHVVSFDSLSVTLRFYSSSDSKKNAGSNSDSVGNWETYLVQGSPYITAKYSGVTPELTALSDFKDIVCPPTYLEGAPAAQQQQETKGDDEPKEPPEKQEQQHRRMKTPPPPEPTTTKGKKLGICGITTDSSKQKKIITGVQFIVTTQEQLTWLVFASEPITFEFNQAGRHTIQSREKYGGVIRLALVPPALSSSASLSNTATKSTSAFDVEQLSTSSGIKRLIYHAGAYPVGGSVSWDFRSGARYPLASSTHEYPNVPSGKGHRRTMAASSSEQQQSAHVRRHIAEAPAPKENNIGRITFAFDTTHMTSASPNTDVPLLMLALPHHVASIVSADKLLLRQDDFDLTYRSIKGRMVPVVGNTWSYEEELTFMGFGDESLPAKTNIAPASSSATSEGSTSASSQRPIIHESTAISTLDQSIRDLLLQNVESDLKINLPVLVNNGAYGFGKQIARMAQLTHIADVVDTVNVREDDASVDRIKNAKNNSSTITQSTTTNTATTPSSSSSKTTESSDKTSSTTGSGTARRGYALLEKYLTMWLVGDGSEKRLLYDANLGGILSKEGTKDINSDFGNARYNDHHFHYGYVLYASAILGRANPKFIAQYGPYVDALFYDVAYNGNGGSSSANSYANNYAKLKNIADDTKEIFFPLARHKSWYDGHSFASGLFPFANGKSQESSSEAVNCYYGAYLWARVRWGGGSSGGGDRRMVDYARLLLATEMTGAKTYWHMTPPPTQESGSLSDTNNITTTTALANSARAGGGTRSLVPIAYSKAPAFRENYMVGNLGMTDATCTTWFGTKSIYVHLINFMPVTAITAELFDKAYVKGERSVIGNDDSIEKAWQGYSICNEAILDPNNAWIESQSLVSTLLDAGLSKSQVLFWISTRDGFSSGTTAEKDGGGEVVPEPPRNISKPTNKGNSKKNLASCTSHEKCVAENLVGLCCPTNEGIFLRCCS